MWWWIIIFFILLLFIIVLLLRVTIHFQMMYKKEKQNIHISFHVFGICLLTRKIDLIEENDIEWLDVLENIFKNKSILEGIQDLTTTCRQLLQSLVNVFHIFSKFIKQSTLHHFEWQTSFGTGEASSTGVMAGGLWTIKSYIIQLMYRHQRVLCQPTIHVYPLFQQKELRINVSCMLSIRIGQAIYIFLKRIRKKSIPKQIIYSATKGG